MIRILATALLAIILTASGAFATSMGDLVKAGGLYYKKFTDVPLTGKLDEGLSRGVFKNGKREEPWVHYYDHGRIWRKGAYKNGEREGLWFWYSEDGTKSSLTGTYRDGRKISD